MVLLVPDSSEMSIDGALVDNMSKSVNSCQYVTTYANYMPSVSTRRPPLSTSWRAKALTRDEAREPVRAEERPEWKTVSNPRSRMRGTAVGRRRV